MTGAHEVVTAPLTEQGWDDLVVVFGTRGGTVSGAELYHGVATTFRAAGFEEVDRTGPARPVMRHAL
ncbi:MAG: hypothetical protein ABJA74_16290 [Lapillicoccus sp.]